MPQEQRQRTSKGGADRFLDLVNGSGFWKSVDLRFCAIRNGRRWMNLVTRGFLDDRAPRTVPKVCPVKRQHFRAWQVVRPVAEFSAVVRGMATGTVKLRPRSIGYVARSSEPAADLRYSFDELGTSHGGAAYDPWSCHALVGYGSTIWDVVRQAGHDPLELDSMIRGGPNAYDGLSNLVRRFCERPRGLEVQVSATIVELIAPLAVRFERESVTATQEHITAALRAGADVFMEKAELVWTMDATGEPVHHGSADLRDCEWVREGRTLRAQLDIPIRDRDAGATLFILIGDRCVDYVSVPLAEAGTNIRIKAHSTVDPGLERFREHLHPVRSEKAREFETAVGLLFFFLGFQVDPLAALKGLGDTVDHLAHAPGSAVVLVIECTVGTPDARGKLGRLIARSENARNQLPDSEVIAVLTTARPRAELSKAELDKADVDDVVLLAREDLRELWTAAQAGDTSAQVVRLLRQKVHLGNSGAPRLGWMSRPKTP